MNQEVLDDVQLATAVGFDAGEDDKLEATAVVPNYQPDKSIKNNIFSTTAKLSKEARDNLNRKSPKPFVSGKIEVALYSKVLAEKGIIEFIDTFERDPSTGTNIYLAIVEGNIKKKLEVQYGDIDNGTFLSDLIEQNIEHGKLPKTNLHQFTKFYHAEGKDPVLPFLEIKGKEVNIKGVALFKDDKYVDYIKGDDAVILKMLREKSSSNASFSVDLDAGTFASVLNISSKRKIKITDPMTNPSITFKVKTEAIIKEYTGDEELTTETLKKVESKIEEDIKSRAEKMIRKFQDLKIDPLAVGNHIKHSSKTWDKEKWEDLYPNAKIKVEVDVRVSESGVIN